MTPKPYAPNLALEAVLRLCVYIVSAALAPRAFTADVNGYFEAARQLRWDYLPYRDFLWEYPPLAALGLLLGPVSGGSREVYVGLFATVMIALEFSCLALLRSSRPTDAAAITRFWTWTIVPCGAVLYFRLDFIPVFFATVALLALLSGGRSALAIAAGFGAKLWPLILVGPLVALRRYRDAATALGLSVGLVVAWYVFSPVGFERFLEYRRGGGFEIESIPGALLLLAGRTASFQFGSAVVPDQGWEWAHTGLLGMLVAVLLAAFVWMWRRNVDMVAMVGGLILTLVVTSRIISAQYLIWLAPCVVLLWPGAKRQGWLYAMALLLTFVELVLFERVIQGALVPVLILNVRNLILIGLWVELFVLAGRSTAFRIAR